MNKLVLLILLFPVFGTAQPLPTSFTERMQAFETREAMRQNSLVGALYPQNIGPAIYSGRVTDIEANPTDAQKMYVAYATGGLWYSANNGTTFRPVFDQEAAMTIGDIAVDWQRNIIWVGTGEVNSSRSSYAGVGIFRSTDGGRSWKHCGLPESHHIGRILQHPAEPDVLWVAVLGKLYSPSRERGVYKSTDGGLTWQQTLYINDTTGVVDLAVDPFDPNILYAASWERTRRAWHFEGAGAGSAVWKSTDGGLNWTRITNPGNGFPTGNKVGRIGLAAGRQEERSILYACVDNQQIRPPALADSPLETLTKDMLRTMKKEEFKALNDDKLSGFLKRYDFPEKYSAKTIKDLVENNKIKPVTLVEYLEDANANLFETNYAGAELYRSDDGGTTWKRTHSEQLERINFSYGYYFSNVRCRPDSADQVYLLGFLVIKSKDGGATWSNINGDNVHVDHHALWIDPLNPGHLINGNDGGLNISWDDGASWIRCNQPPVAQLYAVAVDSLPNYNVYGGAQDNKVWWGPSNYKASFEWQENGQYPYKVLLGGDGMQIAVDPRDNNTVYAGFQFGNYFRIDKRTGDQTAVSPRHELGERPPRFNWQTPILLSRHNPDVLYIGADKLYRSFNKGKTFTALSHDLTGGARRGNVPYGTITALDESPVHFGVLYAGTDDGLLHVTRDGGQSWTRISDSLPAHLWVSRVQASHHAAGRVYVTLNGYRWDHFGSYIYVSDDYGRNFRRIGLNLPAEAVNVIREDPRQADLLYAGTDHGLYTSLDRGRNFYSLGMTPDSAHTPMPAVPVHDLAIQDRAGDLIIGTHGRSIYKLNIRPLRQLVQAGLSSPLVILDAPKMRYSAAWGKKEPWQTAYEPQLPVYYYVASAGSVTWKLETENGLILNSGTLNARTGLNAFPLKPEVQEGAVKKYKDFLQAAQKDPKKPLTFKAADSGKYYLKPGTYMLIFEHAGIQEKREFIIE